MSVPTSKLTQKQESFAQHVADGLTYSDAYRASFTCPTAKPETINRQAYTLATTPKIAARIEELKAQLAAKQLWTREDSVKTLKRVIEKPDKTSDVVAAVKELNVMHGFNEPIKFAQIGPDGKPVAMPTRIEIVPLGFSDRGQD